MAEYAHPEVLVSTDWVAQHHKDPKVSIVEVDVDTNAYGEGHVPGAIAWAWNTQLCDTVRRDILSQEAFEDLMAASGIANDTTVVIYGDNNNWFAAWALWQARIYGHKDVRLMNGGRQKWLDEGRPMTTDVPSPAATDYPVVPRDDATIRAFKADVLAHLGTGPLVDVRSPGEYNGEVTHMPDYPQEGVLRAGHIPTAASVPWKRAANDDGSFKSAEDLRAIYEGEIGLKHDDDVVAYCRIGERSSHTWFVLTHLLGFGKVRNYDGSWCEWGNSVRVPIEKPGFPIRP